MTLKAAAARYQITRAALAVSRDDLREAVLTALGKGMTESEAARIAGVTRMTIRAWRAPQTAVQSDRHRMGLVL